jgi:hypothetical protein
MTDAPASFAYLPLLRRGLSALLSPATPGQGEVSPAGRAAITVALTFQGAGPAATPPEGLALVGPGEVAGLDPAAVTRTWPKADTPDAERNRLPLIEFSQPDLPWRYTPTAPDASGRLRPWLCLIVLEDPGEIHEFTPVNPSRPGQRLDTVTITPEVSLPKLTQSWAWAHVEVAGIQHPTADELLKLLQTEPHRLTARLLCPRHLHPDHAYVAMLVPAFQRGVKAGLGQPLTDNGTEINASEPAWTDGPRSDKLTLPIYYSWRFRAGSTGDFGVLAQQQLQRLGQLPVGFGTRPLSTPEQAGLPAPSPPSTPLALGGALMAPLPPSPGSDASDWGLTEHAKQWISALGLVLARPDQLLAGTAPKVEVTLPYYGRWYTAIKPLTLKPPPPKPTPWPWFQELNADPRLRVAAALGTQIVQTQQQQLMQRAWEQIGDIQRINQELASAQAAREAAASLHQRHLPAHDPEALLAVTAPVHGRIPGQPEGTSPTIWAVLRHSAIDPGVLDAQWRLIARPLGPLGRRHPANAATAASGMLLDRMNRGQLTVAAPPPIPARLSRFAHAGLTPTTLNPTRLQTAPAGRDWTPRGGTGSADRPPREPADGAVVDHPFRQAAVELASRLSAPPTPRGVPAPVDLSGLGGRLVAALDPRQTIPAAYRDRLQLSGDASQPGDDPLGQVMAAPQFPEPMVEPLRQLAAEWLLPGLNQVEPNTMALLATNRGVVEAYMVGLNHEMARELLWNEYPTDQRGTYFRHFWPHLDFDPADPDATADIKPIHQWSATGALGDNAPDPTSGGLASQEQVVLLLRGELLRRYPTTILYAARATGTTDTPKLPDPPLEERYPSFSGIVPPDIAYFGFPLTLDEAWGASGGPGWYFVLQEPPSEPGFGLQETRDPAVPFTSWTQLAWTDLAADTVYLNPDQPVTAPSEPQGVVWGAHSSDMALITRRQPVRVAVHAKRLQPKVS